MRLPARSRALLVVLALVGSLFACAAPTQETSPSVAALEQVTVTDYPVPRDAIFVATNGQDSAQGQEATPLRSVSEAVRRARPGSTIVLREGTYRESVGVIRKRLTIQPYPGERVWLKGSRVISAWSRSDGVWRHEGWDIDLCRTCFLPEIIDPEYPLAGLPDMVFVEGRSLRQVDSRRAVTAGTFYVDDMRKELLIGDDPTGKLVEATEFDRLLQFDGAQAADSAVRGLGIAQYGSNQDYGRRGAMIVVNAPSITLENNTFAASASSGAAVFQPYATVAGNSFTDNGLVGLVANRADGIRLTANTFARNNREHFSLTGEAIGAAGAKITRTKRPFVSDNAFVHNIGTGWWCDLGCTDAVVIRNLSRGNAVNGLYYEVSARALIASNLVLDNAGRGIKISSSDHVGLYHNTLAGNTIAVGLYNDRRGPGSDDYSANLGLSWVTAGTVLLNNLFIGQRPGKPLLESEDHKPDPKPEPPFVSTSDGNAYFPDGRSSLLATWSLGSGRIVTADSLTRLRDTTGQERHSIEAKPLPPPFRDAARGDYALIESAPGFQAGRPLPPEIAELVGVAPTDRPDIGVLAGP